MAYETETIRTLQKIGTELQKIREIIDKQSRNVMVLDCDTKVEVDKND